MPIEIACLETRRMKVDALEDKLNTLSKKGWKIRCSVNGSILILTRDIMFPQIRDAVM